LEKDALDSIVPNVKDFIKAARSIREALRVISRISSKNGRSVISIFLDYFYAVSASEQGGWLQRGKQRGWVSKDPLLLALPRASSCILASTSLLQSPFPLTTSDHRSVGSLIAELELERQKGREES
jgi:hypothetical protein